MLTEEQVVELLNQVNDPFLHKTLEETKGIKEIKIKPEKKHVSVKVAIAKMNTAEQMQLQQELVGILKKAGAATVGLRFEELPQDVVDQQKATEEPKKEQVLNATRDPHFVAIASGKGGVGKSTVTVNLAMALTRLGKKVGIIDADIYGFSIPDMMGVEKRPEVDGNKISPVERFGIKIISTGFFVEDNSPIIWRGPMLGKMLTSFFKEVSWGELDYLLLDLPPGTGDIAMNLQEMLPTCSEIIITTPHPTAAFVASRAGQMVLKSKHELLGVIENMSYYESKKTGEKEYIFGRGGGKKLAEVLDTKLLGQLPLEQPYEEEDVFAPSVYQEDHPLGQAYLDIATGVITSIEG